METIQADLKRGLLKQVIWYRYIALVVVSLLYIAEGSEVGWEKVGFIVSGTTAITILLHYLYRISQGDRRKKVLLLMIEVLGNALFVILSGGIESPYIWYSMTSIFVMGLQLGRNYFYSASIIYSMSILIGTVMSTVIAGQNTLSMPHYFSVLGMFILVGAGVRMILYYVRQLEKQREAMTHYLGFTLKMYETSALLDLAQDQKELSTILLRCFEEEWKDIPMALVTLSDAQEVDEVYGSGIAERRLEQLVVQIKGAKPKREQTMSWSVEGRSYDGYLIQDEWREYGILVADRQLEAGSLRFMSYIIGMVYRQMHLTSVNKELLINQEQNRIAEEIHDSILQKLFGVSCNLFAVEGNPEIQEKPHLGLEIHTIRQNVSDAMTQLRQTIYGMSWNKVGKNQFTSSVQQYIEQVERSHQIDISFETEGEVQLLSLKEKEAFYRIICEGVSNAVRHGKAACITITLKVSDLEKSLVICDDGIGFDYEQIVYEDQVGIGIKNMRQLAYRIKGDISYLTPENAGTQLEVLCRAQ